jgi:hypothetical protein
MRGAASGGKPRRAKKLLVCDALRKRSRQKRSPILMGTNCILLLYCEMR